MRNKMWPCSIGFIAISMCDCKSGYCCMCPHDFSLGCYEFKIKFLICNMLVNKEPMGQ